MILPSITLQGLAMTSLLVSLLIAAFLPARPLLRRAIGSQWVNALWLALLVRLLMPWPMESRWSVFNRRQGHAAPSAAVAQEPLKIKVSVLDDAASQSGAAIPKASTAGATAPSRIAFPLGELAKMFWLSGFMTSLCALAWHWQRTRRLATATQPATDERLLNIFDSIPERWRRGVELRVTGSMEIPTLAGIMRPQIWMPRSWPAQFTDDELRNVLLHELGHARRGDLIVQWLFAVAQCLHWFNPLVWLAGRAARFDREMACDAWVLARNDADHSGYGAALMKTVQLLRNPLRLSQGTITMASDHRSLRARISGIGGFRPVPAWRGVAAIALVAAAMAVATTSRMTAQEKSPAPTATPEAAQKTSPIPATQIWAPTPTPTPKPLPGGPQVNIKSEFFEISEADAKKLGFVEISVEKQANSEVPAVPNKGVLDETSTGELMKKLNNTASVHLLSAPSVTTLSGQRAVVEIVREIRYPTEFEVDKKDPTKVTPTAFETRNAGITLEVEPTIGQGQNISLSLSPQVVTFLGYMYPADGKPAKTPAPKDALDSLDFSMADLQWPNKGVMFQPIFSMRKVTTLITLASGRSVLLGGLRSERVKGRLLYFLITATIVKPADNNPVATTPPETGVSPDPHTVVVVSSDMPEKPSSAGLQYSTPDKGHPGYVISPYSPDAGLIDVRGYKAGEEVNDPYTGKKFLVPQP